MGPRRPAMRQSPGSDSATLLSPATLLAGAPTVRARQSTWSMWRRPAKKSQNGEHAPRATSNRLLCRSEEHTSELQSPDHLVCRLLLEKKTPNRARNDT